MQFFLRELNGPKIKLFTNDFMNILAGVVRALDAIWFISDAFTTASMEPYFQSKSLEKFGCGYVRENYDVVGKLLNKFISHDPNLISRVRNLLIDAIQEKVILPKYIVMVSDDDLIRYMGLDAKPGVVKAMGRVLNEMMLDHRKVLQLQK